MNILVTGSAGFIGANLVMRLLREGFHGQPVSIIGLDNLNNYYDVSLKEYRLRELETLHSQLTLNSKPYTLNYKFVKGSIADKALVDSLFGQYHFDIVVNLAAQAGVRYSIENPDAYIQSNVIGFYNILEACRHAKELAQSSRAASDTAEKSTRYEVPVPGQSPKEKDLQDLRDFCPQGKAKKKTRVSLSQATRCEKDL